MNTQISNYRLLVCFICFEGGVCVKKCCFILSSCIILGNGGRSNGIEDEQLVDLFNRVISGKPIASRPLPPDQEFEEFRAPVVSRPPPSHLTLLQGHIPHELSVIAEADTPASSSMGASLRSSSHVSGMRMNPIDEHSVSVMGALGESPYLKTRSDDLTGENSQYTAKKGASV